jgi:polyferredoxin
MIENVYRLQVMNTAEQAHAFTVQASGLAGIEAVGKGDLHFDGATTRAVALRLRVPVGAAAPGSHDVQVTLRAHDDASLSVTETAVFIVPR